MHGDRKPSKAFESLGKGPGRVEKDVTNRKDFVCKAMKGLRKLSKQVRPGSDLRGDRKTSKAFENLGKGPGRV